MRGRARETGHTASVYARPGVDTCNPAEERDPSFVYRIDMETLRLDQVRPVGATPKCLAVSPDGRFLLVADRSPMT